jgi:two-component system, NarL family, sensor histidine kinase UhpB
MQANSTAAAAKAARLTIGERSGGHPAGTGTEMQAGEDAAGRAMGRGLLRVPLFYKILIANAVILTLVIVACGVAAHATQTGTAPTFLALLGGGLAVSIASNAVILRLALSPLRRLERTAESVQAGDLSARVEPSELADRDLMRLMTTFNMMLDSGATYRRRLRDIAARALNATEDERKRIARELHDGIAQTMAALRVQLRVARSVDDASTRDALLEKIGGALGDATEEVRRIAQGLRPPALDMLGLAPAIESCARSIEENTGLQFDTALSPVEGLLAPEAELALYRIVQEALSNVARHANAGTVRLRLSYSGRFVTATVEDDGDGFAVGKEMAGGGGLGLYGMQERAAYVGGTVEIDSEPGSGTRVRAIIPVVETARYV